MITTMQINMLKHAASIDMQHVVQIYLVAMHYNDGDTADYILDNYVEQFSAEQNAQVEEFFARELAEEFAANSAVH